MPAIDNQAEARRAGRQRVQDPEGVKRDILDVAMQVFVAKGYSGARVDDIAARTRTSKRMIYYYFGDKEGLYIAVLEEAYRGIRSVEEQLALDHLDPIAALAEIAGFTFDYQNAHPQFVRLVMIENIHGAAHMRRSKLIAGLNVTAIEQLKSVIARGTRARVFRKGLDAVDLHMTISALAFFNVANRATFSTIFRIDMASPRALAARRRQVVETVLRYASRDGQTC